MENHGEKTSSAPVADLKKSSPPWYHSLTFIFVVALLLRLLVITVGHTYRINPRGDHFQFGWEMGRIARSIASGQGFGSPTDLPTWPSAWTPPIYPYILAGIFKIFGIYSPASAWMILAFNSLFGALTCITIYRIAERIFGTRVARASAWIWAVFPYAIYWPVRVVWEASLSTFLLSLALLLTIRMADNAPRRNWLWFGLLWGTIALTNTALLSMFPLFLLWLLYHLRNRPRQFAGMCLSVLVAALVVSPWLVRDNLPLEMYVANNDHSAGLWTRSEHPGNDPDAMRHFQQIGELPFMEEKHQQFRQFVHEHPGRFLEFTLERALYFWIGTPQNATVAGYNLLLLRHATFFLASALAFAGLWLTFRNRRPSTFLFAYLLLCYPLPYYLVNPFPRYKHPIEPEMIILIVYLITELIKSRSTIQKSQA
jgi:4-amino-4-deoxy-L-arabinose transferase-like glycosyltransferase